MRIFSWRLNYCKGVTLIGEGFFELWVVLQVNNCDLRGFSRIFAGMVFGAQSFLKINDELSEEFERLSESIVIVLKLAEANCAIKQEQEDQEET